MIEPRGLVPQVGGLLFASSPVRTLSSLQFDNVGPGCLRSVSKRRSARNVCTVRCMSLGSSHLAKAVEAHLRALCADAAAESVQSVFSFSDGKLLPPTWPQVLQILSAASIVATPLSRLIARFGLFKLLCLTPEKVADISVKLRDELSCTYAQRARLLSHYPALLENSGAQVEEAILSICATGLSLRDVRRIALRWPQALNLLANQVHRVSTFLARGPVTFPPSLFSALIRRAPWVLALDVDTDIAPVVSWLYDHVPPAPLYSVILSSPTVLVSSRTCLSMSRHFLLKSVPLSEEDVVAAMRAFPPILTCSVHTVAKPVLYALRKDIGLSNRDISKVVRAFPAVLTLDVGRVILPVVTYLREVGIRNIARVVKRIPPILGYDVDSNIRPKMEYLLLDLKLTTVEILLFPAVFAYSLENRIKPRTRFLTLLRIPVSTVGLNFAIALNDEEYCARVAKMSLRSYILFCRYHNSKLSKTNIEEPADSAAFAGRSQHKPFHERHRRTRKHDPCFSLHSDNGTASEGRIWGKKQFRSTLIKIPWSQLDG